jgi:hypothetical protein|tara:strand:- start:48 stop:632 length:585 start_codon:yes stop_codon:yes gene_type:complete
MKKLLLILICLPLLFGCGNNGVKEGVIERTTSYGGKCFDTYDDYKVASTVCYYQNGVKRSEKFSNERKLYDKSGRLRKDVVSRPDLRDVYTIKFEEYTDGIKLENYMVETHYYRTGERRLLVCWGNYDVPYIDAYKNSKYQCTNTKIGRAIFWNKNGEVILEGEFGLGDGVTDFQWSFILKYVDSQSEIEEDSR